MKWKAGLVFYLKIFSGHLYLQTKENHEYYYSVLSMLHPISEINIPRKATGEKITALEYLLGNLYVFFLVDTTSSLCEGKEKDNVLKLYLVASPTTLYHIFLSNVFSCSCFSESQET
jgi:hypothetical protein